ncbi:MAG: DUF1735 domain-containing protein [Prevotellaceae bacterium]|jgi:hypothetical protein|nr:DUF1735 domain-containing protein [Prevotellaceae bacterium]
MKKELNKTIKRLFVLFIMAGGLFTACDEAIKTGELDEKPYELANQSFAFLKDANSSRKAIALEMRENASVVSVELGLTKATGAAANATISTDASLVEAYNNEYFTDYPAFPLTQVSLENSGQMSVDNWQSASQPLKISLTKGSLEEKTYLLPVVIKESNVNVSTDAKVLYYFVKIAGSIPDTDKPGGVKSICYVEVNNHNPLNTGIYRLKDSGKPFFDICIIFAANLNYDVQTQKPVIFFNENISHLLTHRDKYIKPLQDMGIKVLLDILPNHYGIGWNNLNIAAARDIARQLRSIVDTYGLDGIDFDEEWADYGTNGLPGTNTTSYARILYETRKLMPDKLITLYWIGTMGLGNQIEGVDPGALVDYSYYPYYGSFSDVPSSSSFRGFSRAKWGPYPYAFHGTNGSTANPSISTTNINRIKNDGFGVNLMYDLRGKSDTHPNNAFMDYSDRLTIYSNILYGEETIRVRDVYQKDW